MIKFNADFESLPVALSFFPTYICILPDYKQGRIRPQIVNKRLTGEQRNYRKDARWFETFYNFLKHLSYNIMAEKVTLPRNV